MRKQFLFSCYIDKVKFNQEKKNMKMKYFGKKGSQHFCKISSVQLLFVVASVAVMFLWKTNFYSIWIWMIKRPGTTSDNGFIVKKINENINIKEKKISCGWFWRAALRPGCTNRAWPIQPISGFLKNFQNDNF